MEIKIVFLKLLVICKPIKIGRTNKEEIKSTPIIGTDITIRIEVRTIKIDVYIIHLRYFSVNRSQKPFFIGKSGCSKSGYTNKNKEDQIPG